MSYAAGVDVGGTKIEAQIFDKDWRLSARMRWPTPKDYDRLVSGLADAIGWAEAVGGAGLPVGIAAAGLIHPQTGLALTANLPASGRPLPQDLRQAARRNFTWINDCRALALSEARLGAARGAEPTLGLILGTGLAGGVVAKGDLLPAHGGVGGEFGHFSLAVRPMLDHGLPILTCGCGRLACAETYLSGPGLSRIAAHVTGRNVSPVAIVEGRGEDPGFRRAWEIWLDLATEFLMTLCLTIDPSVIVLGGGLSRAPGLTEDLSTRLREAMIGGLPIPEIRLAEGGDASGARGAALAACLERDRQALHG